MSNTLIPGKTHFIPLQQAIDMTTLYRKQKEPILLPEYRDKNILANCETFNREAIDYLLAEKDCAGIRIYFGMDAEMKVHAILVAVNAANEDLLPALTSAPGDEGYKVVEDGQRCPDDCPPASVLNA